MTTYRNAVRVEYHGGAWAPWFVRCEAGCHLASHWATLSNAHAIATRHAATCEALHRANWAAACRSCKAYGVVAPACPVCLGYGWVRNRTGRAA